MRRQDPEEELEAKELEERGGGRGARGAETMEAGRVAGGAREGGAGGGEQEEEPRGCCKAWAAAHRGLWDEKHWVAWLRGRAPGSNLDLSVQLRGGESVNLLNCAQMEGAGRGEGDASQQERLPNKIPSNPLRIARAVYKGLHTGLQARSTSCLFVPESEASLYT